MNGNSEAAVYKFSRRRQVIFVLLFLTGAWFFSGLASLAVSSANFQLLDYLVITILTLSGLGTFFLACSGIPYIIDPFLLSISTEGLLLRRYGFVPWKNIQKIGVGSFYLTLQFTIPHEKTHRPPPIGQLMKGVYQRKGNTVLAGFQIGNAGFDISSKDLLDTLRRYYTLYLAEKVESSSAARPVFEPRDSILKSFSGAKERTL